VRAGVLSACLLTAAFVGLQFLQWHGDWGRFHPQKDAYASVYYSLQGLLWAHAAVGVLLLGFVAYQAWRRAYHAERSAAVQVSALYVHFVAAAALAVLLTVYVSPHL
jgi:heme/copper-type cytochrome/quinol oxidase subunit 3